MGESIPSLSRQRTVIRIENCFFKICDHTVHVRIIP